MFEHHLQYSLCNYRRDVNGFIFYCSLLYINNNYYSKYMYMYNEVTRSTEPLPYAKVWKTIVSSQDSHAYSSLGMRLGKN